MLSVDRISCLSTGTKREDEYGKEGQQTDQAKPKTAAKLGIQFADMLAGVIQTHHQARRSVPWLAIAGAVRWKPLFFNGNGTPVDGHQLPQA